MENFSYTRQEMWKLTNAAITNAAKCIFNDGKVEIILLIFYRKHAFEGFIAPMRPVFALLDFEVVNIDRQLPGRQPCVFMYIIIP